MAETNKVKDSKKVFTKLSKNDKAPPIEKALIASVFSKQGNLMKSKRYFVLHDDCIYYFNDEKDTNPKGFTRLDFGLRFEILREKIDKEKQSPNKQKIAKPRGIVFDRDGCSCEIYSNDEQMIYQWRNHLRARINQRGFHELFRALKKIGKGNFASVYLAERLEDERMFAVKAFSKEAAFSQEKGKEALITEIELMRALDHSNIMKLHEVFETDNSLYFILDLLEGGQLYDKIKLKYKFSAEEVKSIMSGLMGGLAHMHERKIMHRDLKPENIIFRKTSTTSDCVIADLGLGTKYDLEEYLFVRCGTPGFVAPEVVNIKDMKTTYGPVCDIFSLGLIFHILLIGKPPFNGKTYNDVLAQNRAGIVKLDGPEFLRVPNDAYDLLKKMLVKEPENRITSAQALKHKYFQTKQSDIKEESKDNSQMSTDQFSEEEKNLQFLKKESSQMQKVKSQVTQQSPVMASPMLMPRKLPQQLDQDSCVQFKMNQTPIITGFTDDVGKGNNSGSPGSVFVMNQLDTPSSKLRQLGMSPQVGKSPMSQLGRGSVNNPQKNDQVRKALMLGLKEDLPQNNLKQIDEAEEDKQEQQQQQQQKKTNNAVKNNLKNMI